MCYSCFIENGKVCAIANADLFMNSCSDFVRALKNGETEKTIAELKTFMKIELSNMEDDENLDDEEYMLYIEKIELASFALSLCGKLRKEDIIEFLCITIDCVCSFKQDDISAAFSGIFENLILANKRTVPNILLTVVNFCFPYAGTPSTSYESISKVLSFKTRQKLDNDDDLYYCSHICDNILSAISSEKVKIESEILERFWPLTQYLLQHKNLNEEWIYQSCIQTSLSIIRQNPEKQLDYIDTFLTSIERKERENVKELDVILENFLEENKVAIIHKNDVRNTILKWFLTNLEVKGFVTWIVKLANITEPDVSKKYCLNLMEMFVQKVSEVMKSSENIENLHNYLDVLASLMKICKIPVAENEVFRTVESFVNETKSVGGEKWTVLIESLLKVQSPSCQTFVRSLVPTPENLWSKLRNGESKVNVVKMAITIGSCHFLNSEDDKKQIIPILLLTCLDELLEKFDQKWDKTRLHISGSPNRTLSDLTDFSDWTLMTDENLKFNAVNCALLIDPKPRQLVQLVADMAIAMICKKTTDVGIMLPFLSNFLEENTSSNVDIINALLYNSSVRTSVDSSVFKIIEKSITPNMKLDEIVLENLVKKYSTKPEFIKMCNRILQITSTSNSIFGGIVKSSIKMMFTKDSGVFLEFWEQFASYENLPQAYIPILNRLFVESNQQFGEFLGLIVKSRLPDVLKITVFASLIAHQVASCDENSSSLLYGYLGNSYKCQFEKYRSLFARSLVSRILFDTKLTDEIEIREILRSYITIVALLFDFNNIQSFLRVFRTSLIYWSLVGGGRGSQKTVISAILDFVCQEFVEQLAVSNSQPSTSQNELKKERKNMITHNFSELLQNWKIEKCKGNDTMWKFCDEYCEFGEDDVRNCISIFRKDVVQRLIIADADDFTSNFSGIVEIIRKTYENLCRGRPFSIATIMEYRSEGLDLLAMFRAYFTQDRYFSLRQRAARSFSIIVANLSTTFFDENWWSILLVLRHSPQNETSTVLTWECFIERIDYGVLRVFLWRIVSDISRLVDCKQVNQTIWKRLNFAGNSSDLTIRKYSWLIPHDHKHDHDIAKYRKFEDLLQLMSQFEKYPITLYLDNIRLNIDRGTIWKCDLPRLVNLLISMLVKCENSEQQKAVSHVLETVPILSSCATDSDFARWDMSAEFYLNPSERTQPLLDECLFFVEKITSPRCIEFADKTLCEVAKYIDVNNCEDVIRKSSSESAKIFYNRMKCTGKPEPENRTCKKFDFENWLTTMIGKCILEEEDSQFTSFLAISNVRDVKFLTKLFSKFLIHSISLRRENLLQAILTEFDQCLHQAFTRRISRLERRCATFVFYVFDFLYFYMNTKIECDLKKEIQNFWRRIIENTIKDEHGHDVPLIVRVAEKFGMEKRGILWMEMFMGMMAKKDPIVGKQVETSYYFTLMNLYARIGDLNGLIGSYNRLSKIQVDHVFAKILLHEAHGRMSMANVFYRFVDTERVIDPLSIVQKELDEINSSSNYDEEVQDYEQCLKSLTRWQKSDTTVETPQVFSRNIEMNAQIANIFEKDREEALGSVLDRARSQTLERLTEEASIGGVCSYETAIPYIVRLKIYDEIEKIKNASNEDIVDIESNFWTSLQKQITESEQHSEYLEPILRCRRLAIFGRMKSFNEKERDRLKTIVVDSHLHSARLARLRGCFEAAQVSILLAKKVQPFNKRIVLEEAKLQLQTSDDETGMNLLNSLLATTFGELSKHFGDSQQTSNLEIRSNAIHQIEHFQSEEKNLYSSVQMLRISHLIRLGNTITFGKVYEETNNLLNSFVSSGVMYEAAWLLDYLSQFTEKPKGLPLLKAYKDVAKYEKNTVLQARAVERMTSLWLEYSRKFKEALAKRPTASEKNIHMSMMNTEMKNALNDVGWRAFYPAYAILARKIDHEDTDVFLTIKQMMIQLIIRLPHQCMWQSVHILRSDDAKKKERYEEVLKGVTTRQKAGYSTIFEQYDFASATFKSVSEKVYPTDSELSTVVPDMKLMIRKKMYSPKAIKLWRRPDPDQLMIAGIMVPIRSDIDSSVQIASEQTDISSMSNCQIDDRYLIHDFSEKVKILTSNTKPVLVELVTMTGRKIKLIFKKDDDLTKDYHFTKMVEMCNDLLAKDEVTRISNLSATTYSVIPLAKTGGIIEFIDGVTTYYDALNEHMNLKSEKMSKWANTLRSTPNDKKAEYFRTVWCEETPLVMAKWFRIQYPEAGKWYSSRKLFAKSCAVMSIIGFIFGLGDRHTRNLMIHLPTGKCVHVDFDMILNLGEFLDCREVVPFRLTRNMVDGMGEVALDGEFRVVCEQTLRVFRENSYEIEKYITDLPDLVSSMRLSNAIERIKNDGNRDYKYDIHSAKNLISGRLRGQLITAYVYRNNAVAHPLSNVQLAAALIELARSDEKLVEMFSGWMPNV